MNSVTMHLSSATLRDIDAMAAGWGVSRSEAVTRIVARIKRSRDLGNRPKPWAERIAAGLCGKCGTDRPLETASMCASCASTARSAQERLKKQRREGAVERAPTKR